MGSTRCKVTFRDHTVCLTPQPQEAKTRPRSTWSVVDTECLLMKWLNPFSCYFYLQFIRSIIKNLLNAHHISGDIRTNKIRFLSLRTLQSYIKRGQISKESQTINLTLWCTCKTRCIWDTKKGWPVLLEAEIKV